jgi:adenylate cyclase
MPNRSNLPWYRYLPVWIIFGFGVTMSIVAFIVLWNWENRRRDYEFNQRTEGIANTLQQYLDSDLEAIRTIGDFFTAATNIDQSSFERLVQRPLSQHLSIESIIWVPRISDEQRYAYEDRIRQQGDPNFVIKEGNSFNQAVASPGSPEYFPISYIEPIDGNESLLGFDLASNPRYRPLLEYADQKEQLIITGLMPWNDPLQTQEFRLFAIQPIYQSLSPDSNQFTESTQGLQGYIFAILRIQNLFEDKFQGSEVKNLNLYLCTVPENKEPIAARNPQGLLLAFSKFSPEIRHNLIVGGSCPFPQTNNAPTELLDTEEHSGIKHRIKIANKQWDLFLMVTQEYREIEIKHWRSWATLMIGLLWTLIPVTYMLTSMSRTAQIEKLAHERTEQAERLKQAFQQLESEQKKSERLLLNVLPKVIAERLKQNTEIIADNFAQVTILFADIVGFTKVSTRIPPARLVELLNEIFSAFDQLAINHGLEKIKTIGDAYMVVGGLPVERPDHAEAIAEMALDMQEAIAEIDIKHREVFCMRIGIHSGPVIAGVIGTNKFIYDLWGDSVNIASRMESHGIPGCIQVSEATYQLLHDKYIFEKRGTIPVKGRGEMTTYLLLTNKKINIAPSL